MRASLVVVFGLIALAGSSPAADNLVREVRHELVLVPGYTAFDWLSYRVDGTKVTLLGTVVHADLKRDAENAVKRIEGVGTVQSQIEVLPASASDEQIRVAVLESINKQMSAYMVEMVRRIHIVVKNGNVTLEGEISNQADKDRAAVLAKHVQNVRDVANNLVIQK
jgi:hyperosmotically inducible periplasmic protein